MPRDSNKLATSRGLEVKCDDSRRISLEIEKLRSQLGKENVKLMVEMDLKDKEVQCLRKQNKKMQAKYDELKIKYMNQNEEFQYDKQNVEQELQIKYEKQNEELQTKFKKQNKDLQSNYEEEKKELQGKYEKMNEELHAKFEKRNKDMQSNYKKKNEEMQAKYENQYEELEAKYRKQDKELQAKYEKQNNELQTKYEKQNKELQAKYKNQNQVLEVEAKYEQKNEELQSKYEKQKQECQAMYENQNKELKGKLDGLRKDEMIGTERDVIPEESLELDPAWLPYIFDESSFPSVAPECSSAKGQQCATKHEGLSPHKGSMSARKMQDTTCMNAETMAKTPKEETNNEYKTGNAGFTDADEDNIESVCAEEFHSDVDEGNIEYVSAETEFYKFSETTLLQKFSVGQIWAVYSDVDMFPNYYAVIHKVELQNGKLQVRWLHACPQGEQEKKLLQKGRPIACGTFKVSGINDMTTYKNTDAFSHPVLARTTGKRGEYEIIPNLGEIWAVYRNWTTGWTAQDYEKCEYELVEILGHSDTSTHVKLLRKVDGHTAVFMPCQGEGSVKTISKDEYLKFSHQIPCFHLTHEKGGKLRGCLELDPFSLPDEFLTTNSE